MLPAPGRYRLTGARSAPPFLAWTLDVFVPAEMPCVVLWGVLFPMIPEPSMPVPGPTTGVSCDGMGGFKVWLGGVMVGVGTCEPIPPP